MARAMAAVTAAVAGGGGAAALRALGVSRITPLPAVLDAAAIEPLLRENAAMRDALLPLLPPGQQTPDNLYEILRSPQLRQAAGTLTGALEDSNAAAVFSNFGLRAADGDEAMAAGDSVGALVAALIARAARNAAAGDGAAAGGAGDGAAAGGAGGGAPASDGSGSGGSGGSGGGDAPADDASGK